MHDRILLLRGFEAGEVVWYDSTGRLLRWIRAGVPSALCASRVPEAFLAAYLPFPLSFFFFLISVPLRLSPVSAIIGLRFLNKGSGDDGI